MAWINLGNAYKASGQYEQAAEAYRQVTQLMPREANGYYWLGQAYKDWKKSNEAIEAFERALQYAPSGIGVLMDYGDVLDDAGRTKDAEDAYRRAVKAKPNDEHVWTALGSFLRRHERYDDACATYQRALEVLPRDMTLIGGRLGALRDAGRDEELAAAIEQTSRDFPGEALGYAHRARRHRAQHDCAASMQDYAEAVRRLPTAEMYNERALAGLLCGAAAEARSDLRTALEKRPGHALVSIHAWIVEMEAGNRRLAEDAIAKAVAVSSPNNWYGKIARYYAGDLAQVAHLG